MTVQPHGTSRYETAEASHCDLVRETALIRDVLSHDRANCWCRPDESLYSDCCLINSRVWRMTSSVIPMCPAVS